MENVYELYDDLLDMHVSYHKTLEGAFNAMAAEIQRIAPGVIGDMKDDPQFDCSLKFRVRILQLKE